MDLVHFPAIERSSGEAFRGTDQDWIADDVVGSPEDYIPLVAVDAVWVAEADSALAGFIATESLGDDIHIWELAVHRSFQHRGLGRRLMAAALAAARDRAAACVTLTTFRTIPWNAPFYASLGFDILAEPDARLAAVLAGEAARGLTDRCAMRLTL